VGVWGRKMYHGVPRRALPIHLFRHFCCRVYHLATMHSVTDRTDRQHCDANSRSVKNWVTSENLLAQLRLKSITPVSRSKSVTSWQLTRLQGSYGETCVMDFGYG